MESKKSIVSLALIDLTAAIFAQTTPPQLVQLPKEPPAEMQKLLPIGQKPESDVLHLAISMPYANGQAMQAFADAVSDPKNPLYRHFLTPEQIGQKFGLPALHVERIRKYLEAQGMDVRLVSKNRLCILADATVAQAQSAFNVSIENFAPPEAFDFTQPVRFSFTTPPQVPVEISSDIVDIEGMESFTRPISHTALTATQLRTLYSAATLYSGGGNEGAGRTIAISNYDGYRLSNISLECTLMSLPAPTAGPGTNVTPKPIAGGTGSTGAASGEGDLDIQAVLCMAPLANVLVYDNYQASASTGNNPIAVLTQEEEDDLADIVTESYGWSMSTSTALAAHNMHLSMTGLGMTYMAAAGDHGTTWTVSGVDYDYPAIEPEVLLVGGTSVTVTSTGTRSTEVGWNSLGDFGGGGWNVTTDTFNTRPTYQSTATFLSGAGVPSLASVPYRLVPDVAFDADPNTGYLVYVSAKESQIGGTSGASPTCAGLLAEMEAQLITDGALTANAKGYYRMGRIQDLLYSYNGNSSVFYDVTSGTNGTLPNSVVSEAGKGWDTDSGWGPIIFTGLLGEIEQGVSSVALSPTSVTGGSSSTGAVTLDEAAPAGGAVVTLSSSNANVTVPASVTVAAGATTAAFTAKSVAVTAAQSATITATYNKIARTAALSVSAATVSNVALSASTVVGGCNVALTGTVTLTGPAPTGGLVVTLSSSTATAATVPSSVTVAAGATTATFTVNHLVVSASTSTTIKAVIGSTSVSAALSVSPFTVSTLTLSPASLVGAASSTATVVLNAVPGATSGAITIKLTSSSSSATVPASVSYAVGAASATFTIKTTAVTKSTTSTITTTLGSGAKTATLTIQS